MKQLLIIGCFYPFMLFSQTTLPLEERGCGLTEENMKPVCRQVITNICELKKAGKMTFLPPLANAERNDAGRTSGNSMSQGLTPTAIRFAWPLRPKNAEKYTYYHLGNYVDLDTSYTIDTAGNHVSTGLTKDYLGGHRTYDSHNGLDIGIGPYSWKRKQEADVYAIAAAPGIIVEKHDGEFDGNCTTNGWIGSSGGGNHIAILHEDGNTTSFYAHMKTGSLTSKNIGDKVVTGEYLGAIASSGRTTGPHLHFGVYVGWSVADSSLGKLIEPFAGLSNYTTSQSLWISQKPYDEPDIYRMETHIAYNQYDYPDFYSGYCDSTIDLSTLQNSFTTGPHLITYRTFLRDWVSGKIITSWIVSPTGSMLSSWANSNDSNYRFFYVRKNIQLPASPVKGTWQYNVAFNNKTFSHYFTVGCVDTYTVNTALTGNKGYIAGNNIASTATIAGNSDNNVEYHADNYVKLNPGFTASKGCTFTADTRGCVNGK